MMHVAGELILGLLLKCMLPCILLAGEQRPEWMQMVTPAGEPAIQIKVSVPNGRGPFRQLTLMHRLRFDGVHYSSEVMIAELSSRLIPRTNNEYEWLAPDGKVRLLHAAYEQENKGNWHVVRGIETGETAVVSGGEMYLYKDSFLIEYEADGIKYVFSEHEGVMEVCDQLGNVVIRRVNLLGDSKIEISSEKVLLTYDAMKRLRSCAGSGRSISFGYWNGLLISYSNCGSEKRFEWGSIKNLRYHKPAKVLPPVITSCGEYVYKYLNDRKIISCEVYKNGARLGSWTYFVGTGQYWYSDR